MFRLLFAPPQGRPGRARSLSAFVATISSRRQQCSRPGSVDGEEAVFARRGLARSGRLGTSNPSVGKLGTRGDRIQPQIAPLSDPVNQGPIKKYPSGAGQIAGCSSPTPPEHVPAWPATARRRETAARRGWTVARRPDSTNPDLATPVAGPLSGRCSGPCPHAAQGAIAQRDEGSRRHVTGVPRPRLGQTQHDGRAVRRQLARVSEADTIRG